MAESLARAYLLADLASPVLLSDHTCVSYLRRNDTDAKKLIEDLSRRTLTESQASLILNAVLPATSSYLINVSLESGIISIYSICKSVYI